MRREQEGTMMMLTRTEPVISTKQLVISITDPVAGVSYSLDSEHKIAWRTPMPSIDTIKRELETTVAKMKAAQGGQQVAQQDKEKIAAEKMAVEARARGGAAGAGGVGGVMMRGPAGSVVSYSADPGPREHKTLDGLAVEGHKTTTVIPAGAVGNDQPITVISEEWTSPDLKGVLVLTRHSDPRSGESSYRLANIVRTEPDPSLFMVPSDYEVRDTGIRRNEEELARKKVGGER
jgi:hypothetical protein